LIVFQHAIEAAVRVFKICRTLPESERRELRMQWLRASRSVPANLAEAWRKRYYRAHFVSKLSDAEGEAAECQVWALLSYRYGYISEETSALVRNDYDVILRQVVTMSREFAKWSMPRNTK
jgi:four helix bundle protein